MAFSKALVSRYTLGNGVIREVYSFNGDSVTTGTVSPDTADAERIGVIKLIDTVTAGDDSNAVRWTFASAARAAVTLTFTANDLGWVVIEGKAK